MKKSYIFFCLIVICIVIMSLSACELLNSDSKDNIVYDVDNRYFEKATFERHTYTNVNVNNNQSTGARYEYIIEISSKCTVSLFEYDIISHFYDSNNNLLKTFEKHVEQDIKSNERFKVECEVSAQVYNSIDHISTTLKGKSYQNPADSHNDAHTITNPIETISLNIGHKAIVVGDSLTLTAAVTPSDTDDYVIWSSTDENILTVDSGVVKAVGVGTAGIKAKAENGKVEATVSLKVMPKSNGMADITKCKTIADSAILTITNKCYNTFLGITTKSETKTFTATIFKQSGTTYYFITGYENFKKIDGYDYQEWTATDCNGKEYKLNSIQHEKDTVPLGNNYAMAVGSINAYNLGVLPIASRGYYYSDERLFIKNGTTFTQTSMSKTIAAQSPITSNLTYKDSLYGATVLDSDFNFVGFVIRKDVFTGNSDFVATWAMEKFIKSCGISI